MKTKFAELNGRSQVFDLCRFYKGFICCFYNMVYAHASCAETYVRKYTCFFFLRRLCSSSGKYDVICTWPYGQLLHKRLREKSKCEQSVCLVCGGDTKTSVSMVE